MGTRERKQREFEQREALFLDTAARMIAADGLLNLQMAKLAEACDYATGTLYQHFCSREDLLVAVAAASMREHHELFERAAAWEAKNRDRMFAIAVADVAYHQLNPVHAGLVQYVFTEVVWSNASETRRSAIHDACQPVTGMVDHILSDAIEASELESANLRPMELALGPWSLCHGMRALVATHGLLERLDIRQPERLLYRQVQVYLNGLNWQPLFPADDPRALDDLVARARQRVLKPHDS